MRTRVGILLAAGLALTGCTDMKDQPRYEPLEASAFFDDGQSARSFPEGTVARGQLREDDLLYRGLGPDGQFATGFPMAVTSDVLHRGQERFGIFCTPCHDRTGHGNGMIVQRGYKKPPSLHEPRLRASANGYLFDVVTHGFNTMQGYAAQIPVADRWAIIAYVRALQLSEDVDVATVPAEIRSALAHQDVVDIRATDEEEDDDHGH